MRWDRSNKGRAAHPSGGVGDEHADSRRGLRAGARPVATWIERRGPALTRLGRIGDEARPARPRGDLRPGLRCLVARRWPGSATAPARSGCADLERRIDAATGEVVSSYPSGDEPLGVDPRPLRQPARRRVPGLLPGLRRGHLPADPGRAAGGKTVPESVADNPLVFATLTAPSFGHVHGDREHGGRCRTPRHGAAACGTAGRRLPACGTTTTTRAGSAAVPGLLRLRLRRGVAVVGPRAVAAVHHHPAPAARRTLGVPAPGCARSPRCSTPRSPSTSAAA